MRDHGGDLDRAIDRYGPGTWLDLSTGINAQPYPVNDVPDRAWASLPTNAEISKLEAVAAANYQTSAEVVAMSGAQAAIQLVPRLRPPGRACVVGPTYNEHAAALQTQGWDVSVIADVAHGAGADLVIVVNPNNPDGRVWSPEFLREASKRFGLLIVDESFADADPDGSIARNIDADEERIVVLRSFGKFYGLAGLRLGFAIAGSRNADRFRTLAGPWAVGGPAIAIGQSALVDKVWQKKTRKRLLKDVRRLDACASLAGWNLVGGTALFRTYDTLNSEQAQDRLASRRVWSRIFPYSKSWLRLGMPGTEDGWAQLENAIAGN